MKTAPTKKAMSAEPKPPAGYDPSKDEDRKWKAEDALRTLTRAQEIQNDRRLMQDVDACRREKMRQLANIEVKVETAPKTIKSPK